MLRATSNRWFWILFFLSLQVLVLVRNWVTDYWVFYWFRDFASGLFALFFLFKTPSWIKGLLNIGLVGQILYLVSFSSAVLFHVPLFGFLIDLNSGALNISITFLMHCSTIVAWYATRDVKPETRALEASAGILIMIYTVVMIATEPATAIDWNFNYIYTSPIASYIPYYTTLWVILAFCVVALPSHALQCLWYDMTHKPPTRITPTLPMYVSIT